MKWKLGDDDEIEKKTPSKQKSELKMRMEKKVSGTHRKDHG